MRAATLLFLVTALAGCSVTERVGNFAAGGFGFGNSRVRTDRTVPYQATLIANREDPRDYSVLTREVGITLDELRESLRYPATRYCLSTFGASDADWALDPATGDWAVVSDGTQLAVNGRCTAR